MMSMEGAIKRVKGFRLDEGDIMDKNKMENSIQEKDGNRDEYAIYDYLKLHPGVLISCISAMVMILTFIINYAIYLRTSGFLAYWGVESLKINMNNANLIYTFAGVFIYYMMVTFIQPFIIDSCEKYFEEMKSDYYIRYFRKHVKKEVVQCKKNMNPKKKDKTLSDIQDEEDIRIEKYVEDIKGYIKESKKLSKKISKIISKKMIISIVIAFLGLSIATFFLMLISINSYDIITILMISIICASITLVITLSIVYFIIKYPKIKKIKKEISEKELDLEKIFDLNDNVHYEYPIDKIFNMDFKEAFRDKAIASLILQITIGALFLLFMVYPIGANDTKNKQEFVIVTEDGQDYVIIYNNDNCYYLVEALIEDKKITIDTTKQSVVVKDKIVYENMKFEEVVRKTLDEKYD